MQVVRGDLERLPGVDDLEDSAIAVLAGECGRIPECGAWPASKTEAYVSSICANEDFH